MSSIGRLLVMESAIGCTTGHDDMATYIEDLLRQVEAHQVTRSGTDEPETEPR